VINSANGPSVVVSCSLDRFPDAVIAAFRAVDLSSKTPLAASRNAVVRFFLAVSRKAVISLTCESAASRSALACEYAVDLSSSAVRSWFNSVLAASKSGLSR
jgi:hypothetical protein